MRAAGGVLLVSLYELGHQPAGLAFPLAALEQAGFSPRALDLSVEELDPEAVRGAGLIAVSVPMHTAMRIGAAVAGRIRALNPGAHLCFYGLYAVLNAGHLLATADSVLGGEIEPALVTLAEALEQGERGPIEGVTFREKWQAAGATGTAPAVLRRVELPVPSRDHLPPLERYARLDYRGELRLAGYTEATRGCKHHCRHCPIPPVYGGRFFAVPAETVLGDIRRQVTAGARHVTFGDPDFLNGPTHALRIARALHAAHPEVTFDFTAKVEHLLAQETLLPELASLGCLFIVSAVESVSEDVLARLRKRHTRADVARAAAAARRAGIALRPSLMPFTPWAGLDDYLDLLRFSVEHELVDSLDPVQFSIRLLVPPGSLLLEGGDMDPYLGPLDAAAFSYTWTHPDPRMDALHQEVAARVERAAQAGEPPRETFRAIWSAAHRAAGLPDVDPKLPPEPDVKPPRLTEAWFC
ncbi:MAG: CUAEP/CCAEP-tail radical SAM (seleno)protein [Armatimonadota bacterium]